MISRKGRSSVYVFWGEMEMVGYCCCTICTPTTSKDPDGGKSRMISYAEALQATLERISPLGVERVALPQATGRVCAEEVFAQVDSPSADVSFKDGYAVRSGEIAAASPEAPVRLQLCGVSSAGHPWRGQVERGMALRILSGGRIPAGADAVLAEEFTRLEGEQVLALAPAEPGRNILRRGCDLRRGQILAPAGTVLHPAQVGLAAAGGHTQLPLACRPRIAILATGDEVVAPGGPLDEGMLYASNLVNLASWCAAFGWPVSTALAPDEPESLQHRLSELLSTHDALLTSGGSWSGDRDLVVRMLDGLGWEKIYHRVRIGPGKGVGFGLWQGKADASCRPVFCLPGGPPSNYMAFLHLALPGLMRLAGYREPGLTQVTARLEQEVGGQIDWTQFVMGRLEYSGEALVFQPLEVNQRSGTSRLAAMAAATGVLAIPEGTRHILAGTLVQVHRLSMPE
jgi:molybdopterin molybdotransferase